MAIEKGKPKYEVGDIVTIKSKREGTSYDYRFSFTNKMLEDYGGKKYVIVEACFWNDEPEPIPDDGYRYKLQGADFSWASSMFEESSRDSLSCISDSSDAIGIEAFVRKKKCPELDFNL